MKNFILLFTCLVPLLGLGQSYSIGWYKIAGGGSTSSGGTYVMSGTIGQLDAGGPRYGGNYSLNGGFWSLTVLQTPGSPGLFIVPSGTNVVLFWKAGASAYDLQSNTDLATAAWSLVSQPQVIVNETTYVTNAISAGNCFFRLRLH